MMETYWRFPLPDFHHKSCCQQGIPAKPYKLPWECADIKPFESLSRRLLAIFRDFFCPVWFCVNRFRGNGYVVLGVAVGFERLY